MSEPVIRSQETAGSLAEIARQVGLSTATVSRVLNNAPNVKPKTRQRVLQALNARRFSLHRGLSRPVVGVAVFDFHPNRMRDFYMRELMAGLAESALQHDFTIRPVDMMAEKRPRETYPQLVMRLGLEGIIQIAPPESSYGAILDIADAGFHQCLIGARLEHPGVSWIDCENVEATRKAIKYLINLGHRRIAVVTPRTENQDQIERLAGYRSTLAEAGIPFDPGLHVERRDVDVKSGASAVIDLLTKSPRPTAIYFTNGELAVGGVKACHKMNLTIPDDLSIVTFDDSQMSEYLTPSLTCIRQPVYEMGLRAGQLLASHVKHDNGKVLHEIVVPDFFINESTGPAKGGS